MGKAADVHPAAGVDLDAADTRRRVVIQKVDGKNLHHPRVPLHRLAPSGLAVERLTAFLERRIHGGHLFDPTRECRQSRLDPLAADRLWVTGGGEGAFAVAGVGCEAERHSGQVRFRPCVDEVRDPGRAIDQDRQDTLGRRVKGSAVARLEHTREPAQRADNGEG